MKNFTTRLMYSDLGSVLNNSSILLFRIIVSLELIIVHGLKKIGIGIAHAEIVPNPLGLPEMVNHVFATSANIVFPLFIIFGLFTRLATLPILAVTLTGYFVVHGHDPLLERDIPFMYSLAFLFIFALGPGKYSLDAKFATEKK